jgi:hypothetical protein
VNRRPVPASGCGRPTPSAASTADRARTSVGLPGAHADADWVADKLAAADAEIVKLRFELAAGQSFPAAGRPFAVTLPALPEDAPVDALEVTALLDNSAEQIPDPDQVPTLEQMCDRADLPESVASQPGAYPGRTAGLLRRLVAEFAKVLGMTVEAYLAEPVWEWKAGLADERVRRRQAGVKQQIAEVEQRKRGLAIDRSEPDDARVDLMARYEAGAQRAFERDLKALLALQDRRRADAHAGRHKA